MTGRRALGVDLVPRLARLIVGAVFAAFASVYVLAAIGRADLGAVAAVVAIFMCQIVYVVPRLKHLKGPALPAVQAALAYAAVLAFGTSPGVLGFLVGSLLTFGRRVAITLAAAVVVSGAAIAAVRSSYDLAETADAAIGVILAGPLIFGLIWLAERVDDMFAARLAVAMAAAAKERLRIAAELNAGLGRGLDAIATGTREALDRPAAIGEVLDVARDSLGRARAAATDFRSLSLAPEAATARALLSSAGIGAEVRISHTEPLGPAGTLLATVLREAVTDVVRQGAARHCLIETAEQDGRVRLRVVSDGARTVEIGAEPLAEVADRVRDAGGALTTVMQPDGRLAVEAAVIATPKPVVVPDRSVYTLSVGLLVALMVGFSAKGLLNMSGGWELVAAAACLTAICALQLLWTRSERPPAWPWSLAAQALLTYVPLLWFGEDWPGAAGFLVGSLLLALPARASWPLTGAVLVSVAVIGWRLGLPAGRTVNFTISALVTGLIIYGLVRLAQLVRGLQAAGAELARSAVVQERLRAARDLHDLLGHSLAAILLKCELARRLSEKDPVRARTELADVLAMTEQAQADMRTVSGSSQEMSLEAEADSARSVLAAAGVQTKVDLTHDPLPAPISTALSAVLREAVTNVLRHSAAERCHITTSTEAGIVRLAVENDGLSSTAGRPPGSGLGNLTTRLAALDGTLTARADADGWFRLTAALPTGL